MLEYLGYLASVVILVSLLMTSTRRLRWINLAGGILWTIYGILLPAYPVAIMNACIACVNIYFLYKMYTQKDYFKTLSIDKKSEYMKNLMNFYKDDILKYFESADIDVDNSDISFYVLRNVMPVGVFVGNKFDEKTLRIEFDYVLPNFRDFKMGEFIYQDKKDLFIDKGYESLIAFTINDKHESYLKRMGFKKDESLSNEQENCYRFNLK